MTHDPLCPSYGNPPWITVCQCELIAKVRADQDSKWLDILRDRRTDLESCGKPDNCAIKAQGVQLALDDAIDDLGIVFSPVNG